LTRSSRRKKKPSRRKQTAATTTSKASWLRRHPIAVILGLTLVVKCAVLSQLHNHPLLQPVGEMDSAYYVQLAQQVASGDVFLGSDAFFISPLYIYFLALVFFVFGPSLLAAKVIQILLGTVAVGLIYATTRLWFHPRPAWMAAVIAAGTGLFTFYEVVLLQASIDPFLTALELFLISRAATRERAIDFAVAGAALGLHALNRPNVLIYAGVLTLMVFLVKRTRVGIRQAGLVACGLALAIAPVTLRNTLATGELILISSHGGLNFYMGNHAGADGTYQAIPGITANVVGQAQEAKSVVESALGHPVSTGGISRYFYQQAWQWIAQHPWDAAALFAKKTAFLLNATPLTLNYSYTYYSRDEPTLLRALIVGPWCLIPLGLVGIFLLPRQGNPGGYWGWALFVPVYALSVVAFFVSSRYRLPLLVPLCAGAGATIHFVVQKAGAKEYRELLRPGVAVILLSIAVNWNLGLDDARWGEQTAMIMYAIEKGREREAQALFERLEPHHPQPGALHFMVGKAYQARSRNDAAIDHFERALEIDVGEAEIQLSLGQALVESGKPDQAIAPLRAAHEAKIAPEVSAFYLAQALAKTGKRNEALAFLETITLPANADPMRTFAMGELALVVERPDLAEGFFRRSVERMPEWPPGHEQLGIALSLLERFEEAIVQLEQACRLDPSSAGSRFNLAIVYARVGRFDDSRTLLQEALRLQPDYERAQRMLEQLNRL
jgi:tetratricopeptide (TPR) repeat protein